MKSEKKNETPTRRVMDKTFPAAHRLGDRTKLGGKVKGQSD